MLTFEFPMISAPVANPLEPGAPAIRLSRRPPWSVDRADILIEIDSELAHRRTRWPNMIAKGSMRPADAERWTARLADVAEGIRGHDTELPWAKKVGELRRILHDRRRNWPARIANRRLIEAEAAGRTAAIEAAHMLYWIDGLDIDEGANSGEDPVLARPTDRFPMVAHHLRAAAAFEDAARAAGESWARPIIVNHGVQMLAGAEDWHPMEKAA